MQQCMKNRHLTKQLQPHAAVVAVRLSTLFFLNSFLYPFFFILCPFKPSNQSCHLLHCPL